MATAQVDKSKIESSVSGYMQLKVNTNELEKIICIPTDVLVWSSNAGSAFDTLPGIIKWSSRVRTDDGYEWSYLLDIRKPGLMGLLRKDADILILIPQIREFEDRHTELNGHVVVMVRDAVTVSDAQKIVDRVCNRMKVVADLWEWGWVDTGISYHDTCMGHNDC